MKILLFLFSIALAGQVQSASKIDSADHENATMESTQCSKLTDLPSDEEVRQYIMKNYQKSVRPRKNSRNPVDVELYMVLQRINKIVEKEQEIHFTGYLGISWTNDYFVWNDTEDLYCVEMIQLPSEDVWLPDVAVVNSGNVYGVVMSPGHKVEIHRDGRCVLYPETTFSAFCNFDLSYFPFDDQLCSINVESWLSSMKVQRFNVTKPGIFLVHWSENEMWQLAGFGTFQYLVTYEIDETNYDRVEFMFYLKRKAAYYNTNVILPSTIISCVELVTFMLPTAEVLKMVISFTALLAYTVFQLMIVDDIPRSGTKTPLLSIYIVLQMAYIALALMGEGFIYVLIENVHKQIAVPKWLDKTARTLGCLLGLKPDQKYVESVENHVHACRKKASRQLKSVDLSVITNNISNNTNKQLDAQRDFTDLEVDSPQPHSIEVDSASRIQEPSDSLVNACSNIDRSEQRRVNLIIDELLTRSNDSRQYLSLRHQWLYVANVSKRLVFLCYFLCVLLTPLVMFVFMPMTKPDWCGVKVECFESFQ